MIRAAINELVNWKLNPERKPLVIRGARQVGKTWIMKEFGRKNYHNVVYVNFEQSELLAELFVTDFSISRILQILSIESNQQIHPKTTLIIFDEIQAAEKGLLALKYFQENANEYHVICAGSLLGIALNQNTSFPVGKVDFLDLFPMSFEEFLLNAGKVGLAELIQSRNWELMNAFHSQLVEQLRIYYFVGGMPEVQATYFEKGDFKLVRTIQKKILIGYEQDFSKHAPNEIVPRIRLVWNALLSQLAKENKKFIYGQIKKGARAKEFELAIAWLVDAGLVYKINQVKVPNFPLVAYAEMDVFKLYFIDLGLLAAMGDLDPKAIIDKNTILKEFKGSLTEQFVLQELKTKKTNALHYWTSPAGIAEIDFVFQSANEIIPIEVKAEENLQAKSLKVYCKQFQPSTAIRTSMSAYRVESWMVNVPLYAIGQVVELK